MTMLRGMSFSQKIIIAMISLSMFTLTVVLVPIGWHTLDEVKLDVRTNALSKAKILAEASSAAVVFDQADSAEHILQSLKATAEIESAAIYNVNVFTGNISLFATYSRSGEAVADHSSQILFGEYTYDESGMPVISVFEENDLTIVVPITVDEDTVGFLQIQSSLEHFKKEVEAELIFLLLATIVAIVFAFVFARFARNSILNPLQELNKTMRTIGETKDYSQRAHSKSTDELGRLTGSFNNMLTVIEDFDHQRQEKESQVEALNASLESKIKLRTQELETSMLKLQSSLDELNAAKDRLVEQEKMASLGGLVAGVAHEINTPVGVAITAASHNDTLVRDMYKAFKDGNLTETEFCEVVEDLNETNSIILRNLERAASLVKSFKLVAVDQSSEQRRKFNLHEYLENIVTSLSPRLKRTGHKINLDVDYSIMLFSYPGTYSQIFTNLILNSVIHGFKDKSQGVIEIKAKLDIHHLQLDYFDNGCGIPDEVKPKLYDPFVTTNRDQGGSGLGTHILYNLVTQALEGTIELVEDSELGVHFRIKIPLNHVELGDHQNLLNLH